MAKPRPQPTEPEHKNALTVFYQTVRRRDSRAPRHKLVGVQVRCQQLWIVLSLKPPLSPAPPGGESLVFPSSQVGQSPGRGSSGGRGLNAELPRFGPAPFRALRQPVKHMQWWVWRLKRCGERAGMPAGAKHAAREAVGISMSCIPWPFWALASATACTLAPPLLTSRFSWCRALRTVVSLRPKRHKWEEQPWQAAVSRQCLHLGV